jgi:hypothetical protein
LLAKVLLAVALNSYASRTFFPKSYQSTAAVLALNPLSHADPLVQCLIDSGVIMSASKKGVKPPLLD